MTNKEIYDIIKPYTLCSFERTAATIRAVKHVVTNNIEGDFIECGVYKGGQVIAMLLTLRYLGDERNVYLYDTFEGMPSPEDWEKKNNSKSNATALDKFRKLQLDGNSSDWCRSGLADVQYNILNELPETLCNIYFVKGLVEDTLPNNKHDKIALLRLDTDWYSSTKIELELLYPKLQSNGYLIIDDYGHWSGAKKAVDDYIENNKLDIILQEDDGTGRSTIKP